MKVAKSISVEDTLWIDMAEEANRKNLSVSKVVEERILNGHAQKTLTLDCLQQKIDTLEIQLQVYENQFQLMLQNKINHQIMEQQRLEKIKSKREQYKLDQQNRIKEFLLNLTPQEIHQLKDNSKEKDITQFYQRFLDLHKKYDCERELNFSLLIRHKDFLIDFQPHLSPTT